MSLMQLLTTGRSLVGQDNSSHRYQMTNHKLLPKFGSKRNPFVAGMSGAGGSGTVPVPTPAKPKKEKALPPSIFSKGAMSRPWTARLASWLGGLKGRLRRSPEGTRRIQPTPGAATRPTAVVQGELLLEGIKVVRNDLSETDLEIVTAKPAAPANAAAANPMAAAPVAPAGAEGAWDRIRSRLTGVGKN